MSLGCHWEALKARVKQFARARRGNVAMIFALSLIPITVAAGAGLDLSRALIVRARLAEALDAAGLAVGATQNLTSDQIQRLANAYFAANYTADSSFGTPGAIVPDTSQNGSVILTVNVQMPTTLMNVVGIDHLNVGYSSKVVWGQTKLWVALVLDNTGSMCQPYKSDAPCLNPPPGNDTKIAELISATHNLLTMLQGVAANPRDVMVSIVPFTKDVNVGTGNVGASWINWSDWESTPANGTPSSSVGPGSSCPYSTSRGGTGYACQSTPVNGSASTSTIPSSGTYQGYICPGIDSGSANSGRASRYYNGCYDSTAHTSTQTIWTCTGSSCSCGSRTSCSCAGRNSSKVCTQTQTTTTYTHVWQINNHSTWDGCVMDRDQDNDVSTVTPTSSSTEFYAENTTTCHTTTTSGGTTVSLGLAPITSLTDVHDSTGFANLGSAVDAMQANGNTNQAVGIINGLQTLTDGNPWNAGTLPMNTTKVIIILSDGLNTQNRWSSTASDIDAREALACTAAKNAHAVIYAVFVDLNGAQGNSAPLQSCATDSAHYFDLTSASQISTAFNTIGTQITQLRVAQ